MIFKGLNIKHKNAVLIDLEKIAEEYEPDFWNDGEREINYNPFKIQHVQCYTPIHSILGEFPTENINEYTLNSPRMVQHLNGVLHKGEPEKREVFVKFAPLLDPIRYMIGKYDWQNTNDPALPTWNTPAESSPTTTNEIYKKINHIHNASYVDAFFCYLSGQLHETHRFTNGIEYFGSFLGIQDQYKINITDDIEYLNSSKFFKENLGIKFMVSPLSGLSIGGGGAGENAGSRERKMKISWEKDEAPIDIEELIEEPAAAAVPDTPDIPDITDESKEDDYLVYLNEHIPNSDSDTDTDTNATETSDDVDINEIYSVLSSEDSNSNSSDDVEDTEDTEDTDEDDDAAEEWETDDDEEDEDADEEEEENVNAYVKNFPVQMICLEKCKGTFDELLENEILNDRECLSAIFQIVMSLVLYQKTFHFTHNDLHTNNIVFNETADEFIWYKHNKKIYKVPTYGRIFKIIDFGRSIYRINCVLLCSDSFQKHGDASTQYNTEPFLNNKKPRLDPNYSFDLCRLACSIYDFLDETDNLRQFKELIMKWCQDDKGKNMLYKPNGEERYPQFKLYKMIARTATKCVPKDEVELKVFQKYVVPGGAAPATGVIDFDAVPCYAVGGGEL